MPTGGIYLFLGPDRPRKRERIQALEQALQIQPLDRHVVDASTTTSSELVALSRQQPAMSPRRLILVDQAHRVEASCVDALVEHAELISRNACVVLLVETALSLRHALAKPHAAIHTERFPAHETPAARPFAFTDALGVRDLVGALAAARDQVRVGKEPLELLGLVAWQLNRWVLIKRLVGAGYSAEQMGRAIGLRPWHVQRVHSEVMSRSLESLTHLLERCWQLDVDAKSGRATPGLALEHLVIEVCVS